MNTDIVYKFVGERGSFLVGAPARDIAEWEVMADPDMGDVVEANIANGGGLYQKVGKPSKGRGRSETVEAVAEPVATQGAPSV